MRRHKKLYTILTVLVVTFTMFLQFSCSSEGATRLSETNIVMTAGTNKKLKLRQAKGAVAWSSSNKNIVSVNEKGRIYALKGGTAIFALAFSSFGTYTLHLIFLPVRVTQTIVVFPLFLAFTIPFEVTVAIFLFLEYHFLAFEFLTFKVNFFFLDKVNFSLLNPTTTTLHLYVFFFVLALI